MKLPGTKTQSVEISETEMEYDSSENEYYIPGNLGGRLIFESMIIQVIDDNGQDYTLLKTNGYNDNEASGGKYSDYADDSFDDDVDGSLNDYEEEYSCENNPNDLCIVGDFSDAVEDFRNGDPIQFKNVDEIGEDGAYPSHHSQEQRGLDHVLGLQVTLRRLAGTPPG